MKKTPDESKTDLYHLIANSFIKLPEPTGSCSAHAHTITMSLSCHLNLMNKLEYELNVRVSGSLESDEFHPSFLVRFVIWGGANGTNITCHGKWQRSVCVFGVGDLPALASRPELAANKFQLDFEPLALDCMEQLHYKRLAEQMTSLRAGVDPETVFDTSLYAKQQFAWNHL